MKKTNKPLTLNKKIVFLIMFLLGVILSQAQSLKSYTLSIKTDSTSYVNIASQKVWNASQAAGNKQQLDYAFVVSTDAFGKQLEWYNLSGRDGKTPEAVNGTNNKIVALSLDKDQFEQCKTMADLQRMTGHITNNSFSHFSGIGNGQSITQHCFLLLLENGKRGLLYLAADGSNQVKATFKM